VDLLDTKYRLHKNEFPLYLNYPFQITAYMDQHGVLIDYKLKAGAFKIQIQEVDRIPRNHTPHARFYLNHQLLADPREAAERDLVFELNVGRMYEENERLQQQLADKQWQEFIESETTGYLKYLDKAYEIKEITCKKRTEDLFFSFSRVSMFLSRINLFARAGADTMVTLHNQITDDLFSSMFLCIHGKYGPAMSILRRVLETSLKAIYVDYGLRNQEDVTVVQDRLLKGEPSMPFTCDKGAVTLLLDPQTDHRMVSYGRKYLGFQGRSYVDFITEVYHRLSSYVHAELPEEREKRELVFDFTEYEISRFDAWKKSFNDIIQLIDLIFLLKFSKALNILLESSEKDPLIGYPSEQLMFLKNL
jgi:hypothetical protein